MYQGFPDTKISVIPKLTGKATWDLGFKSNYGTLLVWGSSEGLPLHIILPLPGESVRVRYKTILYPGTEGKRTEKETS